MGGFVDPIAGFDDHSVRTKHRFLRPGFGANVGQMLIEYPKAVEEGSNNRVRTSSSRAGTKTAEALDVSVG